MQNQPLEEQKQSPEVFYKKVFYKKFQNPHRKKPVLKPFENKVAGLQPASFFRKKTPTQVISCEVCYFDEHLQTMASGGV